MCYKSPDQCLGLLEFVQFTVGCGLSRARDPQDWDVQQQKDFVRTLGSEKTERGGRKR